MKLRLSIVLLTLLAAVSASGQSIITDPIITGEDGELPSGAVLTVRSGATLVIEAEGGLDWPGGGGGGGGAGEMGELGDVVLTAVATGHLLRYDGANWVNTTLGAGDIPTLTLDKISDAGTMAAEDAGSYTPTVGLADIALSGTWTDLSGTPTTLGGYGITDAVPDTRTVTGGTGLAGGGALSGNIIIDLDAASIASLGLADTAVQPDDLGDLATLDTVGFEQLTMGDEGGTFRRLEWSSPNFENYVTMEAHNDFIHLVFDAQGDDLITYYRSDGINVEESDTLDTLRLRFPTDAGDAVQTFATREWVEARRKYPVFRIPTSGPWTDFEIKASIDSFVNLVYYYHSPDPTAATVTEQSWSVQPSVYYSESGNSPRMEWLQQTNQAISDMLTDVNSVVGGIVVVVLDDAAWLSEDNADLQWSYVLMDGVGFEEDAADRQIWRPIEPVRWVGPDWAP